MTLEIEYPLSEQQLNDYKKDGHIYLKQVATGPEIQIYREEIQNEVKRFAATQLPLHQRDTYGKAFIQVMNLWVKNPIIQQFVLARRFAKIAADLLGVKAVRIYHDQALFKEPGGGHTPWHQDQIYWPFNSQNLITMWMPLVNISPEVGSMTFASGTHHHGYINKMQISDESQKTLADYIEAKNIPTVNYGGMQAGDATFHGGWTLHSAPGNPTDQIREVMTVIYVADGEIIAEPDSQARKKDLEVWLPGCKPGEVAASPLNPIVYAEKVG